MMQAVQYSGYLQDLPDIIEEHDIGNYTRDRILVIATGCQGESQAALIKMVDKQHRPKRVQTGSRCCSYFYIQNLY